jgi:hypothetical protein
MDGNPILFNDVFGDKIKIKAEIAKIKRRTGEFKRDENGNIKYKKVLIKYEVGMKINDNWNDYGKNTVLSLNERASKDGCEDIIRLSEDRLSTVRILNRESNKGPSFNYKHFIFKGLTRDIFFNPNSGMEILNDDNESTGKFATPSELLGHEFKHAANYFYSFKDWKSRMSIENNCYHNLEEEFTSKNYDNKFWKNSRTNHFGKAAIFLSPTDYNSNISNFLNKVKYVHF